MNSLKGVWRGKEKLWKVFWLYTVVLPLASYLIFIALPLKLYGTPIVTYSYFFVGWSLFNSLLLVPMWRCAANTRWWVWTRLARINVLIIAAQICLFIGSGGLSDLSGQNRATSACRTILMDQAREKQLDPGTYLSQHHTNETICIHNLMNVLR
jgi:hypothetical protein